MEGGPLDSTRLTLQKIPITQFTRYRSNEIIVWWTFPEPGTIMISRGLWLSMGMGDALNQIMVH